MRGFSTQGSWISAGGGLILLLLTATPISPVASVAPSVTTSPTAACEEFASGADRLVWKLEDCLDVWSKWVNTVPGGMHRRYKDRELLSGLADEMRQRGTPCLVKSDGAGDGAGSSTMRHLASWMLAREIGCDWVKPGWGRDRPNTKMEENTTWYCHSKKAIEETLESMTPEEAGSLRRCKMISWLYYFHYDIPSVEYPESAVIKTVVGEPTNSAELEGAIAEVRKAGLDNVLWDTLVLNITPSMASRYFLTIGSFDALKRGVIRDILQEMRKNFHTSPRPWYDPSPACAYTDGELNFAIHVRLGDRRVSQGIPDDYFEVLEALMDTITASVLKKGLPPPLFHVFTETVHPCPSAETGIFQELPAWPVDLSQVLDCSTAETPTDCPEATFGWKCDSTHSGMFRVANKPIVLHVGDDAMNALSCMALADGVVMGCSAFGQIAGLFSNGISMFSVACDGARTAAQYKMIPPIAIAERGEMWVPVEGSWRDPRLTSVAVFDQALDQHVKATG